MRRIMVLNPKGGCGKTTLATNLASYFAGQGEGVTLADFDPQGSSLDWLAARPSHAPAIHGVEAKEGDESLMLPLAGGVLIMDAPAAIHGKALKRHVKLAHALLIPVLPSPVDIRAATRFIRDLLLVGRVSREKTRVAVVANRVRENTRIYHALERFLGSLGIPFIATLHDNQSYIRAAEQGIGIFELPPYLNGGEPQRWSPLLEWLESARSRPGKKKAG